MIYFDKFISGSTFFIYYGLNVIDFIGSYSARSGVSGMGLITNFGE